MWWRSRHAELTEGGAIPVSCRDGTSFLSSHGEDGGNRTRNHLRAKQVTSKLSQQSISPYEEAFGRHRAHGWARRIPMSNLQVSHPQRTLLSLGANELPPSAEYRMMSPGGIRTHDRQPLRRICPAIARLPCLHPIRHDAFQKPSHDANFVTSRFLSLVFVSEGARAVLPLAQGTLYSIGTRSPLPTGVERNMHTIYGRYVAATIGSLASYSSLTRPVPRRNHWAKTNGFVQRIRHHHWRWRHYPIP